MRNAYAEETLKWLPGRLRQLLPSAWSIQVSATSSGPADASVTLTGPGGVSAQLDVAVKRWSTAPTSGVAGGLVSAQRTTSNPLLLVTDYTNGPLRQACEDLGISYVDEAGWTYIKMDDVPMFIRTEGTERPAPRVANEVKRLNGVAVGRIIRTLLEVQTSIGVRELAIRAGVKSAGSVSKLLPTLVAAGAIERDESGRVAAVRRRVLLNRWTQDYSFLNGNGVVFDFLATRGLSPILEQLTELPRLAVTGAFASREYINQGTVPVVPPTLLTVYASNPRQLGEALGLVRIDRQSGNVMITAPRDAVLVTSPVRTRGGLPLTRLPQVLADLLTLPGRESLLAEQLMDELADSDPMWST